MINSRYIVLPIKIVFGTLEVTVSFRDRLDSVIGCLHLLNTILNDIFLTQFLYFFYVTSIEKLSSISNLAVLIRFVEKS